jgi:DNA-directed RNA polymerase specialized sigma24 family protein
MTDECLPFSSRWNAQSNAWEKQVSVLRKLVKGWVYSASIPAWRGEEEEVVNELVQEAICRLLERMRKAERQEAEPVNSPDFLSRVIVRHLFIDRVRKEKRLTPLSQLTYASGDDVFAIELADSSEEVQERVMQEALFNELAAEIAKLPRRQKWALLVDIANRTQYDGNDTLLKQALLKAGIHLESYLKVQMVGKERSQFASLLCLSYKKIASLNSMKRYIIK